MEHDASVEPLPRSVNLRRRDRTCPSAPRACRWPARGNGDILPATESCRRLWNELTRERKKTSTRRPEGSPLSASLPTPSLRLPRSSDRAPRRRLRGERGECIAVASFCVSCRLAKAASESLTRRARRRRDAAELGAFFRSPREALLDEGGSSVGGREGPRPDVDAASASAARASPRSGEPARRSLARVGARAIRRRGRAGGQTAGSAGAATLPGKRRLHRAGGGHASVLTARGLRHGHRSARSHLRSERQRAVREHPLSLFQCGSFSRLLPNPTGQPGVRLASARGREASAVAVTRVACACAVGGRASPRATSKLRRRKAESPIANISRRSRCSRDLNLRVSPEVERRGVRKGKGRHLRTRG